MLLLYPIIKEKAVITKIQVCLEAGAKLAWLIDPVEAVVLVFWNDRPLEILQGSSLLPVLSNLQLQLTPMEIFSWMQS